MKNVSWVLLCSLVGYALAVPPQGLADIQGPRPIVAARPVTPPGKYVLKPGDDYNGAGFHLRNFGTSDICYTIGKNGKLESVVVPPGGLLAGGGDNQTFDLTLGAGASAAWGGSGNTITVTSGATSGSGGNFSIDGDKNIVNNTNNQLGNGLFVASNSPGVDNVNTLNLRGEGGNILGGTWKVNP